MKRFLLILSFLLFTFILSACSSFNETYRPLYQIKPESNPIKEEVNQVKKETPTPENNPLQELYK